MFTPIWGRFPIWLIFFRWVETTNQINFNCSRSFIGLFSTTFSKNAIAYNVLIHRIYSKTPVSFYGRKKQPFILMVGNMFWGGIAKKINKHIIHDMEYFLSYISFCSCGHFSPFHVGKQFIHGACGKGFPKNQPGIIQQSQVVITWRSNPEPYAPASLPHSF